MRLYIKQNLRCALFDSLAAPPAGPRRPAPGRPLNEGPHQVNASKLGLALSYTGLHGRRHVQHGRSVSLHVQ